MRRYSFFLLILCLLAACGDDARIATVLNRADSLMGSRPDSALTLLDSALRTGDASDRQTARLRLRRLNAINKLDTVFTEAHVAQASELVAHFDRHGTPNERMLAHYLLGRTYADAGQAPQAIQSYLEAAECADTTSVDCDYRQLCFVYSQMGDLFYRQNLYHESLRSLNKAVKYGYEGKDTLHALLACAFKVHVYSMLSNKDSVLIISENTSNQFRQVGYGHEAASILLSQIRILVERGLLNKAHQQMIIYERESGFFDDNCEIESGREVYYYVKGTYYLAIGKNDSAEYYFRKEIATGRDFNNQNAGSRGLALLFQQTHRPDSAAKYALYSYAMNDSVYDKESTASVAQMSALYNYNTFRCQAQQESERANRRGRQLLIVGASCIVALLTIVILIVLYRNLRGEQRKREKEHKKLKTAYETAINELEILKNFRIKSVSQRADKDELNEVSRQVQQLTQLIQVKESEVSVLNAKIQDYEKQRLSIKRAIASEEELFYTNSVYKRIRNKANCGQKFADDDWVESERFIAEQIPEFYTFLNNKKQILKLNEYHTCILLRLHVSPLSISYVIGVNPSYVTHLRNHLYEKMFGEEGNSKDFDRLLRQIGLKQ